MLGVHDTRGCHLLHFLLLPLGFPLRKASIARLDGRSRRVLRPELRGVEGTVDLGGGVRKTVAPGMDQGPRLGRLVGSRQVTSRR